MIYDSQSGRCAVQAISDSAAAPYAPPSVPRCIFAVHGPLALADPPGRVLASMRRGELQSKEKGYDQCEEFTTKILRWIIIRTDIS